MTARLHEADSPPARTCHVRSASRGSSWPWHLVLLGVLALIAVIVAVLEIGPPSSSARTSREILTAEDGVVQSTVTGTGNIEAGTDVNVNFGTGGTLAEVYVSVGQHVSQGQLLATLDPTSAQLGLEQAQQNLTAAEDQLTAVENGTATGGGSTSGAGSAATGASYTTTGAARAEFVSETTRKPHATTTTPSRTRTPPPATTPARTTTTPTQAPRPAATTTPTTTTTTPSPASIASAQASVLSAEATVNNAQQALNKTKLYAPISGTIVSLANLTAGDAISAGSSGSGSNSSSSSSSSTGSSSSAGGATTAGGLGSSSSSQSGTGSGSSSAFAEIVDTSTMTMTVAFSESDISKISVGQPATVTLDALSGVELGAHVTSISPVGTTSGSVVSYNATLTLDQNDNQVKPGMSASAAVIVKQAQGVNVPNAAVTGTGTLGTVNLIENGKTVTKQVVVGLRGDSRTQIVSGVTPGQQLEVTITLPSLSSSSSSSTGSGGTLGGAGFGGVARFFGGGGFGGGGFRGAGGAGFRGAAGGAAAGGAP